MWLMSLLKALKHRRGEPNKPCVQWQREIKMKGCFLRSLWGGISHHKAFWLRSSHVCKMCTLSHVCRGVMSAASRVKNLSPRRPRAVFFQERNRCVRSNVAGDVFCGGEGMRHWISAWESVPASLLLSCWDASKKGHDTRCSLSPSTQAFHMIQPSLTSPPGWRKKRTLCCFSSWFTSAWVRLCFFLFLLYYFSLLGVWFKTSWLALIWLIPLTHRGHVHLSVDCSCCLRLSVRCVITCLCCDSGNLNSRCIYDLCPCSFFLLPAFVSCPLFSKWVPQLSLHYTSKSKNIENTSVIFQFSQLIK